MSENDSFKVGEQMYKVDAADCLVKELALVPSKCFLVWLFASICAGSFYWKRAKAKCIRNSWTGSEGKTNREMQFHARGYTWCDKWMLLAKAEVTQKKKKKLKLAKDMSRTVLKKTHQNQILKDLLQVIMAIIKKMKSAKLKK